MRITWDQFLRAFRLPFSHGGRNFVWWQLIDRGQRFCYLAGRVHRATLSRRKRVVAVTGTYGKTTTTRAVALALGLPEDRWLDANANTFGLVAWALIRQAPWRRHIAIETGVGRPGTMDHYVRILRPQIVVVTCIGSEHLQSFDDIEHLRAEKAKLVRALAPDGVAVLNADDPNVAWMATQTRARVIRYGFTEGCDVRAIEWAPEWPRGTRLTLQVGAQTWTLRTPLLGRTSLYALLAAVAVGLAEGVPPALAVERLGRFTPTPGRLELMPLSSGAVALCDDYKSSLETIHAALDVLGDNPAARRFVLLGGVDAPSGSERQAYRAVAAHVSRVADHVVVIGHTLREYSGELGRGVAGPQRLSGFEHAPRVADAVRILRARLGPGDVLLVKGQSVQRLRRVVLALQGRDVKCAVAGCRLHFHACDACPLLGRPGPVGGLRRDERVVSTPLMPIVAGGEQCRQESEGR